MSVVSSSMTRDRLDSLRAARARQQDGSSDSDGHTEEGDAGAFDSTMKSFFEEVEGVRADMESIRRVMAEVGVKQSVILSEPRCEERLKVKLRTWEMRRFIFGCYRKCFHLG